MPVLRLAAAGARFVGDHVPAGSFVHLTDGTPYSRTGRNVSALCGATVRPDPINQSDVRVCRKCAVLVPADEREGVSS